MIEPALTDRMTTTPQSPLLEHLLLEDPTWLVVALAGAGSVLLLWFTVRYNSRGLVAGVALLLAAAGVYRLAGRIVTGREAITALSHEAVQSTVYPTGDPARLRGLVDPAAGVFGPDETLSVPWLNHEQIFAVVDRYYQQQSILGQAVTNTRAQTTDAGNGLVLVDVRTILKTANAHQAFKTRWLLTWGKNPQGHWIIKKIRWLEHPDPNGIKPTWGVW